MKPLRFSAFPLSWPRFCGSAGLLATDRFDSGLCTAVREAGLNGCSGSQLAHRAHQGIPFFSVDDSVASL